MQPRDPVAVGVTAADRVYGAAAFGLLWLAARAAGTSADTLRCRRGTLPDAHGPLLWFHGASAGEMRAASALATVLRQCGYRFTAAYTATNQPGVELAAHAGGAEALAALAPCPLRLPRRSRPLLGCGADTVWVGHPLRDLVQVTESADAALQSIGLDPQRPLIVLMPGSRRNEIRTLAARMLGAARLLQQRDPTLPQRIVGNVTTRSIAR